MDYVILKKNERRYSYLDANENKIFKLGCLLEDLQDWKELRDSLKGLTKFEIGGGNISILERIDEYIFIALDYEEDLETNFFKNSFKIERKKLIMILDKLIELERQKPKFLIINKNKGNFLIEGKSQIHDLEFLKIIFDGTKYIVSNHSDTPIKYLGGFLITDFQKRPIFFIQKINNNQNKKAIPQSERVYGEKFRLWDCIDKIMIQDFEDIRNERFEYRYQMNIDINPFIKILLKTQELFNQKVNEITITYENDIFTIESKG